MMRPRDAGELVLLAALWGGSFLFMRVAAPEFGPVPLVFLRTAVAGALLLPLLLWRGQAGLLRRHAPQLVLVGAFNTAIPFSLFTLAILTLPVGLTGIFNASVPLWGALIAWLWLHERPTRWRALGLAIGFAGITGLALAKASFKPGDHGVSPALGIVLAMTATLCYGFGANYAKKRLAGVPSLVMATGSQVSAALLTLLPGLWLWPAQVPGAAAWGSAAVLALACTAFAYLLYFRLIDHVGPAQAMTVTYLIPVFAIAWGALFLGETVTLAMVIGCAVILVGTALASGVMDPRR